MKKILALTAALALAASFAACGGGTSSTPAADPTQAPASVAAPTQAPDAALEGGVTTGGSTSVEKVIGALSEAFMQANTGVDVTYDPTGSGAGITGALEGTLDIGLSSRGLKDEEKAGGLKETVFALDGIAIVVNNENGVADLSLEQIKGLADGTITNWKDVGGADAPVVLIGREAGSGTRDGFESIVDVKDACKYEQELTSTGAVIAAVAANPNAIGYASLSAVEEKVKAVTVEGVADAGSDDAMTAQGMVTVTTHAARLFMPLAELVDLEKEKARIEKELKKNRAELDKLEAKLGNPGFVNKAPAHVVEAEQDRAEKLRALLAKLEESAASMA